MDLADKDSERILDSPLQIIQSHYAAHDRVYENPDAQE